MALKIRLRQQGRKNRQTYRVVVTDARSKRDGAYVEKLGWYIPFETTNSCQIDADRVMYWLKQGAQISDQVKALTKTVAPNLLKEWNEMKLANVKRKALLRKEKKATKQ